MSKVDISNVPQEYIEEWKDHSKIGAGEDNFRIKERFADRKYRKPEVLPNARPGRGIVGPPPEDSTYRCTAIKSNGERCRWWAQRGKTICHVHNPARNISTYKRMRVKPIARLQHLPYVYSKYLSDTLQQRFQEIAGADDRYDVAPELDLIRTTAVDAVLIYDATNQLPDSETARQTKFNAGQIVRDVISQVITAVTRAVDIEAKRKENISVQGLHVLVHQIVDEAYDIFGEDEQTIGKVREFADRIKNIRLPSDEARGTDITPIDDVVKAMDASIPCESQEDNNESRDESQ